MTVATENYRNTHTGDCSTTCFSYTFKILADSHVDVWVDNALKTLGTDYSVTSAEAASGGLVILTTPPNAGDLVVIERNVPLTQTTSYPEGGRFPASSHERALDKLTMISQEHAGKLARAVKLPATSTLSEIDLPIPGAGYYLRWNSAGTALEAVSATVDAGSYLGSGTGAVSRSIASKLGDFISVKDFGATGDGTTDDSASIAAAVAAMPSGGTLYFPCGTFYRASTSPVVAVTNAYVTIQGAGIGVTTIKQGGSGHGITVTSADGFVLRDLSITGSDAGEKGLVIVSRDVVLDRINVSGFLNNGVDVSGASYHGVLRDSKITAGSGASCNAAGLLLGAGATSFRAENTYFNTGGSAAVPRYRAGIHASCATFDQFTSIGNVFDGSPIGIRSCGKFVSVGDYFDPSSTTGIWQSHVTIEANNGAVVLNPRSFDPNCVSYGDGGSGSIANLTHFGGGTNVGLVSGQPFGAAFTPGQITSDQNNYAPTPGQIYRTWRLSSDAARTIGGIAASIDGRRLTLVNVGANNITLSYNCADSIATARFFSGTCTHVILVADCVKDLVYDGTQSRWRIV